MIIKPHGHVRCAEMLSDLDDLAVLEPRLGVPPMRFRIVWAFKVDLAVAGHGCSGDVAVGLVHGHGATFDDFDAVALQEALPLCDRFLEFSLGAEVSICVHFALFAFRMLQFHHWCFSLLCGHVQYSVRC